MANTLKDLGNKAFAAKDYDKAIQLFSQAITLDPSNHVLYSNRSAANAGKKLYNDALEDADKCVSIKPTWGKGYARKGAALHGLRRYPEAIAAYTEGLKYEDSPALRKGLQEVQDAQGTDDRGDSGLGLAKIFQDPNLIGKLAANPRTQKHLQDPTFVQKLNMMQQHPRLAESALSDPRMIDVLGVAMGVDLQGFSREEGSNDLPPGFQPQHPEPSFASSPPQPSSPPRSSPSTSRPAPQPAPEPPAEDVEMTEEDQEEAKAKAEALQLKAKGSAFYKERKLDEAAGCFSRAWELYPKDITFLTNLAAVYFEQGEYDKCIETCEKAVEEGRSLRADYKLVAKALGRIGSAYSQKGDLQSAVRYFQKSLSEHRDASVLAKLQSTEKAIAEAERKAYIDPAKSAIAREEGNTAFKNGDFASAVKLYTESIKRDPSDARGYNNRAAAYMKLMALPEALKDAEEAIKVDPNFVKAYIRKANILHSMREYTKALEALQTAETIDTTHAHTSEIHAQELKTQQALFTQRAGETEEQTLERAMRDPEVAKIMTDPVMQQILQQAQGNPAALQEHMKSPIIREKIMKLINAGIIKTR
ncbi:chaperone [Pisolithus thermaeus]|nr:chaperone [Pisolithus thermaeus]